MLNDSSLKIPMVSFPLMLLAAVAGAEEPFAFRERVLDLHPLRLTEDAAPVQADETVVDADWRIVAVSDDAVVRHAVADLADYFEKSMRAELREEGRGMRDETKVISVDVDPTLKELQSKIDVTAEGIRITGVTAREAMQGCYRLEDEMNFRGRPAVKRGTRTYTRRFSPRMTHSGYELEKFPDAYMDQIAHAGMDAILVFIADPPDVTRNGREDIPALIERARVHGLDVYAYASFHEKAAKMHPLDPGAREYYDSLYGSIVRNAPGLKGLVCVGESVGYPSRDANAGGFWFDPQPGKLMNGFNPFSDWPDWIRLVCDVTRQYKKDFDIIFWTYNWFHLPPEKRLPVVENMPTNVTLLVTWDRGDPPQVKCGAKASVGDYTVTVPGPSQVFESEADVAARRGIKVMTISNTAGRTWDLGAGVPFVPVPWRWQDRYEALRKCNETRGLKALMDSHHYGFTPSFIADFAKVMFTEETDPKDFENVLMALARRDFGDAADAVFAAWKDWSEAFRWHSAEDRDQSGPTRVGPAYPLTRPGIDNPPPARPYTRKNKKGQSVPTCPWMYMFPRYIMPRHEARIFEPGQLDGEIVWAEREVEYVTAGNGKLRAALDRVPARARENARRLLGIGAYMSASARTLLNVKRYYRAGRRLEAAKDGSPEGVAAYREMLEIIEDERKNAEELIPYVEYDSYLGWEPTMGYQTDVPALRHKLKLLEDERHALRALAKKHGFGARFDAGRLLMEQGGEAASKRCWIDDNVEALEEGSVPDSAAGNVIRWLELKGVDCARFRRRYAVKDAPLGPPLLSRPVHRLGYMLDISRDKVPTMESLKRIVDLLARLGYDEFQLYTEHTFAYAAHEAVWRGWSPMTGEEVRELDDYAWSRGVRLVPNQNSFGHLGRWFEQPEYLPLAEKPDGRYTVAWHPALRNRPSMALCPTDPKTLEFLDGLYAELLPNFRHADTVNVGCDEVWDLFDAEGRSAAKAREVGVPRVYLDHLKNVQALLAKRGKRMAYWADMVLCYPELLRDLPKDAVVLNWSYGDEKANSGVTAEYEGRMIALRRLGADVTMCPSTCTFGSWFGRTDRMRGNVSLMARLGRQYDANGLLVTTWGDGGHRTPFLAEVPGLVYAAAQARGEDLDDAALAARIDEIAGCRIGTALLEVGRVDERQPDAPAKVRAILAGADAASAPAWVRTGLETMALGADVLETRIGINLPTADDGLRTRYRELWLRDNRPGGLDDSLGRAGLMFGPKTDTVETESVAGEAVSLLPAGKRFSLVWHDEFRGERLDETKWSFRTNFWGRRFPAFAAPEDGCVEVSGGTAKLKVRKLANGQFVSPQLQTGELMWDIPWNANRRGFWPLPKREKPKFVHRYGYYECRCRLQRKRGWWSAFWMQTETQGTCLDPARAGIEHDIMECFEPGRVSHHCFHMNGYGDDYRGFHIPRTADWGRDCCTRLDTDTFHVFGLLWEPDGYTAFIDGRQHGPKVGSRGYERVSAVPEFILISTECQWYRNFRMTGLGVPELEEAVRANDDFEVDYVRVYDID